MIYVKDANLNLTWKEVNVGGNIYGGGTSLDVNTGDWRLSFLPGSKKNASIACFASPPAQTVLFP